MARNNLGNVLRASGDLDRAIAAYDEAIRRDPNYVPPYNNRALAFANKNEFDRAIADYTAAIRLDPGRATTYRNRAAAYHTIGDAARAIADHDAAIRLDPADVRSYAARGYFHLSRGAADRADVDANEAIRRDPGQPAGFEARAFVAFWRGDFAAAALDLKRALELRPEPKDEPYVVLLRFLAASRSGEAAHAELAAHAGRLAGKQLRERQWPYPVIELHLGRRALDTVLAGARTRGERCEGRFYIAQWHVLRGEKAAAADALRVAAETCPARITEHALVAPELERLGAPAATPAAAAPGPAPATPSAPTQAARRIEATTDNEFRELLKAEPGTIVLLLTSFDPNCRPCIDANRAFESLAARLAGRARFVRIHYEPWSNIPATSVFTERNLPGLPATLLFRGGQEQRRVTGHQPEPALARLLFGEGAELPKASEPAPAQPATPLPRERARPRQATSAFLGCFRDQGNPWGKEGRDLDGARWDDSAMTPDRCVAFCHSQGFAYAATQYSVACFCGNSHGRSGRADNCNMPCGGDAQQICGGAWANSVWRVGEGAAERRP